MNRILFAAFLFAAAFSFPIKNSQAEDDCLCIASETIKKYCEKEKAESAPDKYKPAQEEIARRDIQRLLNNTVNAGLAKDATAALANETEDMVFKDLEGNIHNKGDGEEFGAHVNNYQGILKVSEKTKMTIECLTFKGADAIVYINQHFVRYVPDRKDGSPHEVTTNIIHREIWTFTEQGWKVKYIEELERGNTYLDGKLYNPE